MTLVELLQKLAHRRGLAVSITYDPDAPALERWVASVGLDAQGAGTYPALALGAALVDLDAETIDDLMSAAY